MSLTINTTELDATIPVRAYGLYKDKKYREAQGVLLDILDSESTNWQARLFLGVCYYKTGQPAAAVRAFKFVYDRCEEECLKEKASMALQSVSERSWKPIQVTTPTEFGCHADLPHRYLQDNVESIIN